MKVLQLDPRDNVLVALTDLKSGESVSHDGTTYVLASDINAKHKFPVSDLSAGDDVYQFGVLVGKATQPVAKGELLHVHNLEHAAEYFGPDDITADSFEWTTQPDVSEFKDLTFDGYHREDGQVGTANYWIVIPMVFCENRNLKILEESFVNALGYGKASPYAAFTQNIINTHLSGGELSEVTLTDSSSDPTNRIFKNIDGIKFLSHSMGCGSDRGDSDAICALLAGYATSPNVAGITVLSLGCQHAQFSILEDFIRQRCPDFNRPLLKFEQQKYPSEKKLLEDCIRATFDGLVAADAKSKREPAPLSKLTIGLECGGSDGFSGLSANPAIGHVSDCMTLLGGKSILSEFPELCGVEGEMIKRCKSKPLAERFISIMRAYNARANDVGSDFSTNPSPGNISDGLITDAIKSAGAAKKGGTAPIVDVLDYTEPCTKPGLTLLCTPGNDVESTTAMAGSWANIMLFSTGLGTPTGNPISPVIKVASNTTTATKHNDLIDYDAGVIITGKESIAQAGSNLLKLIIETASGRYTPKAVGLGQDDFIPWRRGVSL
ncbi:MAG: altronate dehydratase family protein [Rubritalea sp.]|uniref:UxaA family hydrolase n=1 Tax=Rubritalea sp. TaxID=2109375 RepID=UPI00324250AE